MLATGVVLVAGNFAGGQHPIANLVAPYANPEEDVTTGGLDLLEIHVEVFGRIGGERFDVERSFTVEIHGPRRLDLDLGGPVQNEVVFTVTLVQLLGWLHEVGNQFR